MRTLLALLLLSTVVAAPVAAQDPPVRWVGAGTLANVYNPAPRYLNDHTVIKGHDGLWHMYGITGDKAPPGVFPNAGLEDNLAHATAPNLTGPWTTRAHILTTDAGYHGEKHLWAPHVVAHNGVYYLFYAAGNAAISVATSTDLYRWTRRPAGPVFADNPEVRDPMVTRVGDRWVVYYTIVSAADDNRHAVAYRTSTDLLHWSARQIAYLDPARAGTASTTESPFVVQDGGWWYLFLGPRGGYVGTDVLRSVDPFRFAVDGYAGHVPAHAAEVVRDGTAWYVTGAGSFQTGLYVGPLRWLAAPPPWQTAANPAVGRTPAGRLELFTVTANGRVVHRVQGSPNGGWTDWQDFGTDAAVTPSVSTQADGRLSVFSLAPAGAFLEVRTQLAPGGGWGPWERFGGPAGAVPAVGRHKDGRLAVFAVGPAGDYLAQRDQTAPNGPWADWVTFGGPAGGPPVVASHGDGRLEVFALGRAGAYLSHRWQNTPNGGWSDWATLGGPAATSPTVGRNKDGRLEVFALTPVGTGLRKRVQLAGGGWSDWEVFGTWAYSPPTVASNADGRVEVFALGPGSDYLAHRWQNTPNGAWSAWERFGGPAQCAPSVGRHADGRLIVFGLAPGGGSLHERTQLVASGGWDDWHPFGGPGPIGNTACGAVS